MISLVLIIKIVLVVIVVNMVLSVMVPKKKVNTVEFFQNFLIEKFSNEDDSVDTEFEKLYKDNCTPSDYLGETYYEEEDEDEDEPLYKCDAEQLVEYKQAKRLEKLNLYSDTNLKKTCKLSNTKITKNNRKKLIDECVDDTKIAKTMNELLKLTDDKCKVWQESQCLKRQRNLDQDTLEAMKKYSVMSEDEIRTNVERICSEEVAILNADGIRVSLKNLLKEGNCTAKLVEAQSTTENEAQNNKENTCGLDNNYKNLNTKVRGRNECDMCNSNKCKNYKINYPKGVGTCQNRSARLQDNKPRLNNQNKNIAFNRLNREQTPQEVNSYDGATTLHELVAALRKPGRGDYNTGDWDSKHFKLKHPVPLPESTAITLPSGEVRHGVWDHGEIATEEEAAKRVKAVGGEEYGYFLISKRPKGFKGVYGGVGEFWLSINYYRNVHHFPITTDPKTKMLLVPKHPNKPLQEVQPANASKIYNNKTTGDMNLF